MNARKPPVSSWRCAQAKQVVDPLLVGLDVAVEHRAVRGDAHPVRGPVRGDPVVGVLLARRDQLSDAVGEHLGAAAGERAQARLLEIRQDRSRGETRELGHVVDLGRGEELQVDVGQRLVQRSRHAGVVVVADVGVLAADHVDLAVALALVHLDGVGDQVGDVPRVGALLPARARERAELALHPAHVGVVQVQVVDEEDLVGAPAQPPGGVGQLAEREHVVALEERDPVVEIEPLAGDHLVADGCERVQMGGNGHEQAESTHSGSLDGS